MEFIVEGEVYHGEPEDGLPPISEDTTVYTDANEFINQVTEQVIPSIAL